MNSEGITMAKVIDVQQLLGSHRQSNQATLLRSPPPHMLVILPGMCTPTGNARDRKLINALSVLVMTALQLRIRVTIIGHPRNPMFYADGFIPVRSDLRLHQQELL